MEEAEEAGSRLANTLTQYDSTLYTCVFIPTVNGEVPPSAEKYRKQARGFYDQFMRDADVLLKVGTAEQLRQAKEMAEGHLRSAPSSLFNTDAV